MKHYLIKIFLSVYCISGCLSVNGQEVVTNPQCNTNLIYRKASLPNAAKRMNDTLQLPFFDDFSTKMFILKQICGSIHLFMSTTIFSGML
jgi:hypothetical protein